MKIGRHTACFDGIYNVLYQGPEHRVALYIERDLACHAELQRLLGRIERYHPYSAFAAGISVLLKGFYRTESRVVILAVNNVDLRSYITADNIITYYFICFCLGKIAIKLGKKIPVTVLIQRIKKSLCASDLSCRSYRTLDVYYVDRLTAGKLLCHPLCCLLAFQVEVCTYMGSKETVVINIYHTVDNYYRNACFLRFLKDCIPSFL